MNLLFLTEGKKHDPKIKEAIDDYTARIGKYFKAEWKILNSLSVLTDNKRAKEFFQKGDFLISLDEKGKELSTSELADFLEKKAISGNKRIVFIIGGAYGIPPGLEEKSDFIWSLSRLTFPHQLARLILTETIYRALSFIKGEPYHHE